jgi:alpha-D-ribose 1-methylphosphonate 5-triphosphate synthase subunit PhnH
MDYAQVTDVEARSQQVFKALMWALSYPGSLHPLPVSGLESLLVVAETLLDLDTTFYASTPELQTKLSRLGGRPCSLDRAQYQFYEQFTEDDLPDLRFVPVGALLTPEDSATLIVRAGVGSGYRMDLRGPGVCHTTELLIHGLPPAFWSIRQEMMCFPLGWDVFLVDDDQLVGIPRTTQVEVVEWLT